MSGELKSGKMDYFKVWEYETNDKVNSVAITPDGGYIVAGSWDKHVYLFSRKWKLLWEYETNSGVNSVAITPDGGYIVAGSGDNHVYLFNREGELLWEYVTNGNVNSVAITPDGGYIVAGSRDKHVYLFASSHTILEMIEDIELIIPKLKSKYDTSEIESLLSKAKEEYNKENYLEARELVLKSKKKAVKEMDNIKLTTLEIKSKYNIKEAEDLLNKAEEEFNKGNYLKAKEYAIKAKNKAIEINKQGEEAKEAINDAKMIISEMKLK